MMYTSSAVEGFHRGTGKVTKSKGAFTSDMAPVKLAYLAMRNISSKWGTPIPNWALIAQQLAIIFGERMPLKLKLHA